MRARPFPWGEAMGFAFATLRLSPHDFWSMTPRELAAAIRFARGDNGAATDRAGLAALMAAFPDEKTTEHDHGRS
jgi:uncharacterized phage protein (TIGR02216 family)